MADTATLEKTASRMVKVTFLWSGSAGTVTVPTAERYTGWLLGLETIPGSTAPTVNYDVDLNDDLGYDLLGSAGDNRSDTAKEFVQPKDSGGNITPIPICNTTLSFVATGSGAGTGATTQHRAVAFIQLK